MCILYADISRQDLRAVMAALKEFNQAQLEAFQSDGTVVVAGQTLTTTDVLISYEVAPRF